MTDIIILQSAYKLLRDLNIFYVNVHKGKFILEKEFENSKIVAFGKNEEEAVVNFYELYQEFTNPS